MSNTENLNANAKLLPPFVDDVCTSAFSFWLCTNKGYPDYNIRQYAKRRTLDGFRMNKNLTDHSKVEEAYNEGKAQLEVVERVVKVYLAYPPKTKNIMELKLQ
ncbi:LYR family of Fe/S cluster biogenesis protein [Raphanus sativus]|nr:LYR family of Fe/S cluster biogenesis protein [Raphanus sativus]